MPPSLRKICLAAVTLSLLCVLASCKRNTPASQAATLDQAARQYVRLAVALGERDKESLDYYYGPADWVTGIHTNPPPYKEICASALQLASQIHHSTLTDPTQRQRGSFLERQLHAIVVRVDILTVGQQQNEMKFDQESQGLLGIKVPFTYDHALVTSIHEQLEQLLPGDGSPAKRYSAFDGKFVIPPAKIPAVMTRALAACRQQTAAHIPLPSGESVSLEYVSNEPWSAFSRYNGGLHSTIQVNKDFVLTVDRALQLACHEGYPGHHVFNSIRDAALVSTGRWPELTVQTTFSPQSLVSESAAVYATQMAFTDSERLAFERGVLFPLAGLDPAAAEKYLRVQRLIDQLHVVEPSIARGYLDGSLEFVRASANLEDEALMDHTKATLLYLNEYRSYVLTYTYGVDLIQQYVTTFSKNESDRWSRYHGLMTSPDTDITHP